MVDLPMRGRGAYNKQTVLSMNARKVQQPRDRHNVLELNYNQRNSDISSDFASNHKIMMDKPMPRLMNIVKKGQRFPLEAAKGISLVEICLGWNVKSVECDVDVSAFLLNNNKVIGDSWFVFYGQTKSPDGSTVFSETDGADRELITIDFNKLNKSVDKIVFVLTINEALQKKLNFSMVKDAYIRIIDKSAEKEIVSFMMDEYYSNVTSMMIGEIYKHNDAWKFNAIGNGVTKDLAGLCERYGVHVD